MLGRGGKEYIFAKMAITLDKLFGIDDESKINNILKNHIQYKKTLFQDVLNFRTQQITNESRNELSEILLKHSAFYSFCIDYYPYIPACICSLGYDLIVIVSENLWKENQNVIIGIEREIYKNNRILGRPEYWISKTPNLLFKLRNEIAKGKKVLIFVDGNKGSTDEIDSVQDIV